MGKPLKKPMARPRRRKGVPNADMFSKLRRSEIMSSIHSRNTKPEIIVRSLLHRLGYRFRLHRADLPGRPDIVLPKYQLAIMVHGCWWHLHQGCPAGRLPTGNRAFWKNKLEANRQRDQRHLRSLKRMGWRTLVIWECQIERRPEEVARRISRATQQGNA